MRRPNIIDFPIIFLILFFSSAFILIGDFINYQRKSIPSEQRLQYRNEEIRLKEIIDIKTKKKPEGKEKYKKKIGKYKSQPQKAIK